MRLHFNDACTCALGLANFVLRLHRLHISSSHGTLGVYLRSPKHVNLHEYVPSLLFSPLPLIHHSPLLITPHHTAPIYQSWSCYVVGLFFYAFHFPEAFFTRPGEKHWLDWVGGGSHGIWHMFVVLAICMHQRAFPMLKLGIERVVNGS